MTLSSKNESDEVVLVDFVATIDLSDVDLERGEGNLVQAVQNVIGHTGAKVMTAEKL